MKVILTGASGFIGRYALRILQEKNIEILAVCRKPPVAETDINTIWYKLDLLDLGSVADFMRSNPADMLIHLAWAVEPGVYWQSTANLDWLAASLHICRSFVEAGGKRIIVAGTCAEYDWAQGMPLNEFSSKISPTSLYGTCKHALHIALQAYADIMAFSLLWCRFYFLYGPGEPQQKFFSSMLKALTLGQEFVCKGANLERDYLYIADAANALVTAALSDISGDLNIASGSPLKLGEMALHTAQSVDAKELLKLEITPCNSVNPPQIFACVNRLRDELGWSPTIDFKTGIKSMVLRFSPL